MTEELIEHGIVKKSENGLTEIELIGNDNCEECSAKLFCNPKNDSKKILSINTSSKYKIGDEVELRISGKNILLASLNLYLYPLLILILTILIGTKLFINTDFPELYSVLSALFFVIIYYVLFFNIGKKVNSVEPKITLSHLK